MWSTLLGRPRASVFHSPQWIHALRRTYGFEFFAVVVDGDEEAVAGVPFAVVDDLKTRRAVVLPFSDFCDPIADGKQQWQAIGDALIGLECPVSLRCLHSEYLEKDERFTKTKSAAWHCVDVRAEAKDVLHGFHRSVRTKINKARRAGVLVRTAAGLAELRTFFDLHLRVRKYRHRLLAQPYEFFSNVWESLVTADLGMLLVAELHGEIIGAGMFLEWGDVLYYKYSAIALDHLTVGANEAILWEAVLDAKRRGLNAVDLGLSGFDQPGLVSYKSKFASHEGEIATFTYTPPGTDSERVRELGCFFDRATELFTDPSVPDAITESAGDVLYRYFV